MSNVGMANSLYEKGFIYNKFISSNVLESNSSFDEYVEQNSGSNTGTVAFGKTNYDPYNNYGDKTSLYNNDIGYVWRWWNGSNYENKFASTTNYHAIRPLFLFKE